MDPFGFRIILKVRKAGMHMKKSILTAAVLALGLTLGGVARAEVSVVEGEVVKVVAKKTEIYVKNNADGKKYEYYFNAGTKILQGGQPVPFDTLKNGSKVKVTADKKGRRFDPQVVEILN
jgi:predicted phage tail protein